MKQSARLRVSRGAASGPPNATTRITATPGKDLVVLHIAGGPELILHPETARDLFLAQGTTERTTTKRRQTIDTIEVPARLQWRGLEAAVPTRTQTRGWLGDVLLSGIDIVTDSGVERLGAAAATALAARVDGQVDAGMYQLDPTSLEPLKGRATPLRTIPTTTANEPILVFVHGTFSNTAGSFGRLWTHHPHLVRRLFDHYGGRVFALDHPTVGASPIANALTLALALPRGARVHLVTHSRGGLVADVLACAAGGDDEGIAAFPSTGTRTDRDTLRALKARLRENDIRIDRIVRVACPARGTLFASKRLDAYLSVFRWTLQLAGVPVEPALADLLAAVATRRWAPEDFPGLAAQIPDSPLIRWLHDAAVSADGRLHTVAGDVAGDSVTSWIKTLLTDALYRTDHDLVVQTRSMYGGARRRTPPAFLLDQGAQVSHFGYFANARTANAIVSALVDEKPHGFRDIGPLSAQGQSSAGGSGITIRPKKSVAPGKRPALVLIANDAEDLASAFASTHEVITAGVEWHASIEEQAGRVAKLVTAALDARTSSGTSVGIVAHGLGGLVARTIQLEHPASWARMFKHADARVLLLGTPNDGWWLPMQLLSGDESPAAIDDLESGSDPAMRQRLADCVALIQTQAGVDDAGLGDRAEWARLAKGDLDAVRSRSWWHDTTLQLDAERWAVPSSRTLARLAALRRRLDKQRDDPAFHAERICTVVGTRPLTPDGIELTERGPVYVYCPNAGDGRVTHRSASLPGVQTWTAGVDHAGLLHSEELFEPYRELVRTGDTALLARLPDDALTLDEHGESDVTSRIRSRASRTRAFRGSVDSPPAADSDSAPGLAAGMALRISVVNGDLSFVSRALMLGHYRSMRLTGTESVMNRLIGGAMARALDANLYPDRPGTHEIFLNTQIDPDNPWRLPRPEAVVVAGLGAEGALRGADLVHSVRQAVLSWAHRLAEREGGCDVAFELAATLIGSGGSGVTVGQAAQWIAQGVREANRTLESERADGLQWPRVGHLQLIELYLDRAGEAWRALRMLALAAPAEYLVGETVEIGTGGLPRPIDSGYRGADYDLISAVTSTTPAGEAEISYTLDTHRARAEVRAQATQATLLRELVARASNETNRDTQIGRTLFQLLVPIEMEPFLGGTTDMVIELDSGTAGIPWEILDTTSGAGLDQRPWAIRTKLLRKLRTAEFRSRVVDADPDARVLVIGEPACDSPYARLPGARAEARAVLETLTSGPLGADEVTSLVSSDDPDEIGADARTILNTLLERNWRIVHVAGHGEPPTDVAATRPAGPGAVTAVDPRGVVLSNGTYLGPREIRSMRTVPELVFVNCCHLAGRSSAQVVASPLDRARFAAGVAEELVRIGVRCVIAAGWAVEDRPACAFASTFYEALVAGRRFIDAVAEAREAAASYGGNTWAAYQCYGDPDWTFRVGPGDAQQPRVALTDELGGIASHVGLAMALETLATRSRFQGAAPEGQRARIRHLEARFAGAWGHIGAVAEAFGAAWAAAEDPAAAEAWYTRAVAANDASASMKATEQLGDLRTRLALASVDRARRQLAAEDTTASRRRASGRTRAAEPRRASSSPRARTLAAARRTFERTAAEARGAIDDAIALLERLVAVEPTMEREALCGAACKRLSLVEAAAGRKREERHAIERMRAHYARAETLGREGRLPGFFYPALNRIAADLVVGTARPGQRRLDRVSLDAIKHSLEAKVRDDPDFPSISSQIELRVYEAIAAGRLARARRAIESAYRDLYARVSARSMWESVRDQAQFVLVRYAARAPAAEAAAARAMLALLDRSSSTGSA